MYSVISSVTLQCEISSSGVMMKAIISFSYTYSKESLMSTVLKGKNRRMQNSSSSPRLNYFEDLRKNAAFTIEPIIMMIITTIISDDYMCTYPNSFV